MGEMVNKIRGKERYRMKQKLRHLKFLHDKYEQSEEQKLQIKDYERELNLKVKNNE